MPKALLLRNSDFYLEIVPLYPYFYQPGYAISLSCRWQGTILPIHHPVGLCLKTRLVAHREKLTGTGIELCMRDIWSTIAVQQR
jgi:hypothetical protein